MLRTVFSSIIRSSRLHIQQQAYVKQLLLAGRPDHDQLNCYHHAPTVKTEAATAVVELLMMGMRRPDTC
jgi:hypothetical protein